MKKATLTAIALFAFGFANAQEVKFGAKAGLNLSSLSDGDGMKTGFHVGGVVEIKFNDKIALQPELMYSMEGGDYSYSGSLGTTPYEWDQEIELNKIILPIMFKYYVIPNLSLEAGPQLDYIVSNNSKAVLSVPGAGVSITEDTDMDETSSILVQSAPGMSAPIGTSNHDFGFKKLNFGVNFGAGYQLPMGLFFQARYNLGLTEFTDNSNWLGSTINDGTTSIDPSKAGNGIKNSNIQISVGYKF
jgi:hypothetical protein